MDEQIEKLVELIGKMPADRIKIVIEKCQSMADISPRVGKLIKLFDKLSPEEQQQFLNQTNKPVDGNHWGIDLASEGTDVESDVRE